MNGDDYENKSKEELLVEVEQELWRLLKGHSRSWKTRTRDSAISGGSGTCIEPSSSISDLRSGAVDRSKVAI